MSVTGFMVFQCCPMKRIDLPTPPLCSPKARMRTALFVTAWILFVVPCFALGPGWEPATSTATVEEPTPQFRKAFWGDSKRQIREKETAEFVREDDGSLTYKTEVGGVPVGLGYTFVNDKLVSAGYLGSQHYRNAADSLDDFGIWKKLLTNRLGEPIEDMRTLVR